MYASIDIGTNTVLLLVANNKEGELIILHEEQRTPRLGKGVDVSKNLNPDSIARVLKALKEYRVFLDDEYKEVAKVIVTATSAVRDAGNRDKFIQKVRDEAGFEITLLTGLQEAEYTYKGALSVLHGISQPVVIDIGGGSTEIAVGKGEILLDSHSFDIGSVRFSERYLKHNPPLRMELDKCREVIKKAFQSRSFQFDLKSINSDIRLVGVAGTVTSLAYMDLELDTYKPDRINEYILTQTEISKWIERLALMPVQEIEKEYPEVMKGRADVIVGGLLILEGFMKCYSFSKIIVSTGGIRHGAIISSL